MKPKPSRESGREKPKPSQGLRCAVSVWFGLGLLLAAGCGNEPPKIRLAAISNGAAGPTMLFEGFHMVATRGNKLEWEFYARAAQVYEKIRVAKAQDIRVVYWRNNEVVSTLTARRGVIQTDNNNLRAEDNVEMISKEGVRLLTERLQWDQVRQKIYTDLPVRVERKGSILTGVGLETDSELKQLDVLSHVKINVPSVKELRKTLKPPEKAGHP